MACPLRSSSLLLAADLSEPLTGDTVDPGMGILGPRLLPDPHRLRGLALAPQLIRFREARLSDRQRALEDADRIRGADRLRHLFQHGWIGIGEDAVGRGHALAEEAAAHVL